MLRCNVHWSIPFSPDVQRLIGRLLSMFSFFDRLSAGWTAGKSCLEVLRNDKRLIVFPVLSSLSALVVFLSFVVPLAIIKPAFLTAVMEERHVDVHNTPIWFWIVTFLFYFCN